MLQVTIEHYTDGTSSVQSIEDGQTVLAQMENEYINLDVCTPYVGRNIQVNHKYSENVSNNYSVNAKLETVEIDNSTGVKCIKYSVASK